MPLIQARAFRPTVEVEHRDVRRPLQLFVKPDKDRRGDYRHFLVLFIPAAEVERFAGRKINRLRRAPAHKPGMNERLEHPHDRGSVEARFPKDIADARLFQAIDGQ